MRLITVSNEAESAGAAKANGGWVDLIHETLIRNKGTDAGATLTPFGRHFGTISKSTSSVPLGANACSRWRRSGVLGRGLRGSSASPTGGEYIGFRGLAAAGSNERGGAWANPSKALSCAHRYWYAAVYRNDGVWFSGRVLVPVFNDLWTLNPRAGARPHPRLRPQGAGECGAAAMACGLLRLLRIRRGRLLCGLIRMRQGLVVGAPGGGAAGLQQVAGGVNQADVGEGLGEAAELARARGSYCSASRPRSLRCRGRRRPRP